MRRRLGAPGRGAFPSVAPRENRAGCGIHTRRAFDLGLNGKPQPVRQHDRPEAFDLGPFDHRAAPPQPLHNRRRHRHHLHANDAGRATAAAPPCPHRSPPRTDRPQPWPCGALTGPAPVPGLRPLPIATAPRQRWDARSRRKGGLLRAGERTPEGPDGQALSLDAPPVRRSDAGTPSSAVRARSIAIVTAVAASVKPAGCSSVFPRAARTGGGRGRSGCRVWRWLSGDAHGPNGRFQPDDAGRRRRWEHSPVRVRRAQPERFCA